MNKINVYFNKRPIGYKLIPGDRHIVHFIKKLLKINGVGGAEKVFINLCKGFDELNISYTKNLPYNKIKPNEPVIMLGDEHYNSKQYLVGYHKPNPIIAGIGLMTHPAEWPDIFEQYPVAKYLQHCDWANNIYIRYYGEDKCEKWPAGVDTAKWTPDNTVIKKIDVLLYNKIRWNKNEVYNNLRAPVIAKLNELGLSFQEVVYGHYEERDYFKLLQQSKAMVVLSEHETQGFALCEAMSLNIPIIAWDPGYCQDPSRFDWNDPVIPTTSVPFFDETCGTSFVDAAEFLNKIEGFWQKVQKGSFSPRAYVVNNISLKKSAERMLEIIAQVYPVK